MQKSRNTSACYTIKIRHMPEKSVIFLPAGATHQRQPRWGPPQPCPCPCPCPFWSPCCQQYGGRLLSCPFWPSCASAASTGTADTSSNAAVSIIIIFFISHSSFNFYICIMTVLCVKNVSNFLTHVFSQYFFPARIQFQCQIICSKIPPAIR